jgi:hypothetical protein
VGKGRRKFGGRTVINCFTESATASTILLTVFYSEMAAQCTSFSAVLHVTIKETQQRGLPTWIEVVANLTWRHEVMQAENVKSKT